MCSRSADPRQKRLRLTTARWLRPFRDGYATLATARGAKYSMDVRDGFYRCAYYAERLLKGANPSGLPFEQTANVKFVVNLKTADALGIVVPQSICCAPTR